MKDVRMTAKRVNEILSQNKYVILRHWQGWEIGINGGTVNTKSGRLNFTKKKLRWKTKFVSFRACGLQEYISKKGYFVDS